MAEKRLPHHEIFWACGIPMHFFQPTHDAESEHDALCPLQERFPAKRFVGLRDYGVIQQHEFQHTDPVTNRHWYCFAVKVVNGNDWLSGDDYAPIFLRRENND